MKNISSFFILILLNIPIISLAQTAPGIQWQNSYGGSNVDNLNDARQTSDGGYLLGGLSYSIISGNKNEMAVGESDYWVVKTNATGGITWQNTIGGTFYDEIEVAQETSDGGYIIGGRSASNVSGDKTLASFGGWDAWIIKLNSSGNIVWQKLYGGSFDEYLKSLIPTADGGYILGIDSDSGISGNKTQNSKGVNDYWIVKISSTGAIEWQKTIGGSNYDYLNSLELTSDGGYIAAGFSTSNISGDKTENRVGEYDYWVIKLNSTGSIEWQNTIGGAGAEVSCFAVEAEAGTYLIAGASTSGAGGDKTEARIGPVATYDYWVLKLGNTGNIIWQNTIGGNGSDYPQALLASGDNKYLIGGYTDSGLSGDKTEANYSPGTNDYWLVRLDFSGNMIWDKSFGGSNNDRLFSLSQSADDGFLMGGTTFSPISGNKTAPSRGIEDYWVIKLNPECVPVEEICNGMDENCNGVADDALLFLNYYNDADADGFGDPATSPVFSCAAIAGKAADNSDCNDADNSIHPGAAEVCNALDDDCTGLSDDGLMFLNYYADTDMDGYGDMLDTGISSCSAIAGLVINNTDCNDADNTIYPGAAEICNAMDENCNGINDDGIAFAMYYTDADADTYGSNADAGISSCSVIAGASLNNLDCNDMNAAVHPGVTEICNSIDDNCNGATDDGATESISISAGGATIFCQGGSVLLTATYSGTVVQWKKDGSNIAGATSSTYSVTKKGNYSCSTTGICGTAISNSINVTVNKNPPAAITAGGPTSFCAGGSVMLTANSGAGLAYQWYKGATALAGAVNISYTATTAGNYKCRVTKTASGCYKNSNVIPVSVPCKEGESITGNDENSISIYPNPNDGNFIISVTAASMREINEEVRIEIYNSMSQMIYSKQIHSFEAVITETIELKNTPSGIYFVKIRNGENQSEQTIMIE